MEPVRGIEPPSSSYESAALPLSYTGMEPQVGIAPISLAHKASASLLCFPRHWLVCVRGFEPLASRFQGGNSTGLSYTQPKPRQPGRTSVFAWSVVARWFAWLRSYALPLSGAIALASCAPTCPPPKVVTQVVKEPVAVACIDASTIPAEPGTLVLPSDARLAADIAASQAKELRAWGRELAALIGPCTK